MITDCCAGVKRTPDFVGVTPSVPTPNTHEFARVVVSVAVGAPLACDADAVAPIAPDPLVPDGSTPVKLSTVIDAATLCDKVAVTVTFDSAVLANARQISAVPG